MAAPEVEVELGAEVAIEEVEVVVAAKLWVGLAAGVVDDVGERAKTCPAVAQAVEGVEHPPQTLPGQNAGVEGVQQPPHTEEAGVGTELKDATLVSHSAKEVLQPPLV